MRKTNPRRRPATQADIKKAKNEAADNAMKRVLCMFLYVLVDKHGAPKEDIQEFAKELNYMADSIRKGYVTWKDIEHVLLEEYELEIDLA